MVTVDVVVLVHGVLGHPRDMDRLRAALFQVAPSRLVVLQPSVNSSDDSLLRLLNHPSFDGILAGSQRLAEWMEVHVAPYVPCRLSVIGHSLGGLHLRGALKLLADRGFLEPGRVQLQTFMTFATPHLGIRETPAWWLPFICINPTGADLLGDTPVLQQFCEAPYLEVLQRFKKRVLYGNALNDSLVQYHTSLLTLALPEACGHVKGQPVLPPITKVGTIEDAQVAAIFRRSREQDLLGSSFKTCEDCPECLMLRQLATLQWDRYPTCFDKNTDAHSAIIAHTEKDPTAEGWDVVCHMAAHFFAPPTSPSPPRLSL